MPQYSRQVSKAPTTILLSRSFAAFSMLDSSELCPLLDSSIAQRTGRVRNMSSQDPHSYLDPALLFPNNSSPSCAHSHSSSASTAELASSPNLYVTFKVLQLVNLFRKRVQTRVHSSGGRSTKQSSSRLTEDFCQAFEREAAEHIDYVLGKTRQRPSRKTLHPDRARKSLQKGKVSKRSVRLATTAKPESESTTVKKIEW